MAKKWCSLLLLINCATIALSFSFGEFKKSIHIANHLKEKDLPGVTVQFPRKLRKTVDNNVPQFLEDALTQLHGSRLRRDVTDKKGNLRPSSSTYAFNDSHTQMVVHWAGKNSDVIIALTKGNVVTVPFVYHQTPTSDVFVSHNYGQTFTSLKDKLKLVNGSQSVISQFFNAPSLNSHYIFVDENSRHIFTTRNYGTTIYKRMVPFKPSKIMIHKSNFSLVLGMDDSPTGDGMLYLSEDFGASWRALKAGVRAFYWEDAKYGLNDTCIYVLRLSSMTNSLGTVIRSCDFFNFDEVELLTFVHDFEIQGPYMFATRNMRLLGGTGTAHQIYVSYYRGRFINAEFPHLLTHLDYYVADASEDQIFMCINHDEDTSHLYISDVNGTKFSQSLENILYFNPNGSNKDSWLKYYMDEPFADIHKVAGMRGVYIATQIVNRTLSADHQRTLISFDKGGEWQLIVAPDRDMYNRPSNCTVWTNCSLHLTQTFDRLYASSRATPILSKESAPGIILATGNTGSRIHIDESAGVFMSTDAGLEWRQVLQGVHFFSLADHGGIILAVKQYEPTNQIVFSTDDGETWQPYNFTTTPIRIHGVLTEPGEKTTVFFLFGSQTEKHSWIVISLNMSSVFSYPCTPDDYKPWSLPDNTPFQGCLLGRKVMIQRRISHTNCYNGRNYVRELNIRNCTCTREDFECDFGYKPNSAYYSTVCIPDENVDASMVHVVPRPCPEGTFYPYTRGYAKISGDTCQGGQEHRYSPLMYACRVNEIEEFMVYSTRRSVSRHIFSTGHVDVLLLEQEEAKNVSAVDYQLGETGCLYWADNELHKIQRLCEDGNHSIEVLHYSNIGEISSLAYDWQGHNIYWIDHHFKTLEVSKANGQNRRLLINGSVLISPVSLALDPHHGWMYWTDTGKIMRAWMDGTNASVEVFLSDYEIGGWVSSITIDYFSEKIFWTGSTIKYASLNDRRVQSFGRQTFRRFSLIQSLAVYKERIYWSDGYMNGIYSCEIADCDSTQQQIHTELDVADLKILDETSQRSGNSACDKNGQCTQLCLLKPATSEIHGKNRTCRCGNNATLSVISPGVDEDEKCCIHGFVNSTGQCADINNNCHDNQFSCSNGNCVSNLWVCDRDNDCGDGSDEKNCQYETCSGSQFSCLNGRCIPQSWQCDFDNDCGDHSDEAGCHYPDCSAAQFRCTDGRCINKSWQCDMDDDCPDASDEANCTTNTTICEEGEFTCPTGRPHCIPQYNVCDGMNQCYNGADEHQSNCNNTCPSWKLSCGNGQCVYPSWRCDGDRDCSNGFDEQNCTTTTPVTLSSTSPLPVCRFREFRCDNGMCIRSSVRCDGVDDCGDNSDEYRCGSVRPHTCSYSEFTCTNGKCIDQWMRCDSHNNCGDNSDERYCEFTTPPVPYCWSGQILCYNSSKRCIDESFMCDGHRDCEAGEDEQHCGGVTCDRTQYFKCTNSQGCIPRKFLCDEEYNCADGSDEGNCQNQTSDWTLSNITCSENYFQCKYENKCIPYMYVCDGTAQCLHKSDENLRQCFDSSLQIYQIDVKMGSTNATAKWAPDGSDQVQFYTFSYLAYFNGAYTWSNITNLTVTNVTITKLHPAMSYYMTVYVTLRDGSSKRYKIIHAYTLDGIPDAPSYVELSSKSDTKTLEVDWYPSYTYTGHILYYEVCIGQTNDTINACIQSKGYRYTFDSLPDGTEFKVGMKYFVQVSVVTSAGEGPRSAPQNVTFGVTGISSYVGDLKGTSVGNNSVNLTWTAPSNDLDKIDTYIVTYYTLLDNKVTEVVDKGKTSLLITKLCAGSYYSFSVAPSNKETGKGPRIYISVKTNGTKVSTVPNITIESTAPGEMKVSWGLPPGTNSSENFTVFYDYKPEDMHSHKVLTDAKKIETTTNSTLIEGLRACELYYFRVALTGTGYCDLSEVKSAQSYYDPLAEAEDLEFTAVNKTAGKLTWKAACPDGEATGYYVYRTEIATGNTVVTQPYLNTTDVDLYMLDKSLIPGATYEFKVRNSNGKVNGKGPRMSEPLRYTMAPYAEPYNLHVKAEDMSESKGTLVWTKPWDLPKDKFKGYEVLLCHDKKNEYDLPNGKCQNVTAYKHYTTSKNTTASYSGLTGGYNFFRVRLDKIDGYYGNLSIPWLVPVLGGEVVTTSPLPLSKTNLIAIGVSVCVVIVALVVIIGCFAVRHRRLQRSFHAYARSHYDSQSGTTTFSAAEELGEDEDSPVIRGFSDDEPLVIA